MLEKIEDASTKCAGGKIYFKSIGHFGMDMPQFGLNATDFVC